MKTDTQKSAKAQGQKNYKSAGKKSLAAANDGLFGELELRYGGGFAQWVVDGMKKAGMPQN